MKLRDCNLIPFLDRSGEPRFFIMGSVFLKILGLCQMQKRWITKRTFECADKRADKKWVLCDRPQITYVSRELGHRLQMWRARSIQKDFAVCDKFRSVRVICVLQYTSLRRNLQLENFRRCCSQVLHSRFFKKVETSMYLHNRTWHLLLCSCELASRWILNFRISKIFISFLFENECSWHLQNNLVVGTYCKPNSVDEKETMESSTFDIFCENFEEQKVLFQDWLLSKTVVYP